jgi:hypothetical protein
VVQVRILRVKRKKQEDVHIMRAMEEQRTNYLLDIGQIKLNGKGVIMPKGKGTYGSKVGRPKKKKKSKMTRKRK